jgi:hypothetical protein
VQVLRGTKELEKLLDAVSVNAANPAVVMTQDTARRCGGLRDAGPGHHGGPVLAGGTGCWPLCVRAESTGCLLLDIQILGWVLAAAAHQLAGSLYLSAEGWGPYWEREKVRLGCSLVRYACKRTDSLGKRESKAWLLACSICMQTN